MHPRRTCTYCNHHFPSGIARLVASLASTTRTTSNCQNCEGFEMPLLTSAWKNPGLSLSKAAIWCAQ